MAKGKDVAKGKAKDDDLRPHSKGRGKKGSIGKAGKPQQYQFYRDAMEIGVARLQAADERAAHA
ncbi:MAG: hypothetical protein AAGD06_32845, partial [Acidobacteriota bacterium]